MRSEATTCSGGATVTWPTSRNGRGFGSGVGGPASAPAASIAVRLRQPSRARSTRGQPPIACSTGASARPSRIEAAIIAPAVISPRSTR
jgi:hypothetical protein